MTRLSFSNGLIRFPCGRRVFQKDFRQLVGSPALRPLDRDTSSCGAPDVWHRRIRSDATCTFNIDDEDCCRLLTGSLSATGALAEVWCKSPNGFRNQDRCH